MVITRQITLHDANQLVLNADARRGSIVAEVLDPALDPIAGRSRAEARPISGDSLEHVVAWKEGSGLSGLRGRTVRLRIWLRDADLYAMQLR